MYKRFSELGWIMLLQKSRAVRVTLEGKEAFSKHLHIVGLASSSALPSEALQSYSEINLGSASE